MEYLRVFELVLQPSPFKRMHALINEMPQKRVLLWWSLILKRRKLWPERAPTRRVGKWASQTVFLWQGDQQQHDTLACHVNPIGLPGAVFSNKSELACSRKMLLQKF